MTDPGQFAIAVLALLIAPGPTNTLMAVAGAGPARILLPLLVAELAGYVVVIAVARLALLPLIEIAPLAELLIKLVVIAYLLYVATRLWRTSLDLNRPTRPVGPKEVFLTTLLNPKGLILAVVVFPAEAAQLITFGAIFALIVLATGLAWFVLGRGLAMAAGRTGLVSRLGSLSLLVFAALLAASVAR